MRLKDGFITHTMGSEQVLIATGEAAELFHGIARSNETAAFIIDCLKEETSPEAITAALCREYAAPEERVRRDVASILATLRKIGALEESA